MTVERFGRYQVKRPLGQGGMGIVHLAYDPQMTREVAIKVLPGHLMNDAEFRTRLEREVKTVAKLEHPCIVPVYDYGEEDRQPYVVMRYMTGGSLLNRIKQHPLTPTELSSVISRIARALDNAHSHNIIHRDIKPGNILFDDQNQGYLSDFGLAKVIAESTIQTGGAVLGTPAYMSPEQGSGLMQIDGRSDIYSLGIIVFEALTGQLPYQADTPIGMMMQHLTEEIPSLHELNPNLSTDYDILLQQAMAKTPNCRYAKAADLADDLAALAGDRKIYPRPELLENATEALPLSLDSQSRKTPVLIESQAAAAKPRQWSRGLFVIGTLGLIGVGLFIGVIATIMLRREIEPTPTSTFNFDLDNETFSARATSAVTKTAIALLSESTETPSSTATPKPTSTSIPTQLSTAQPTKSSLTSIDDRLKFFRVFSDTLSPPPANVVVNVMDGLLQAPDPVITENSLVIDNFESYDSHDALNSGFSINEAWGVNRGVLKLVAAPEGAEGAQALAFEFDINGNEPDDYSGFERKVSLQDWSGYASLCFWLESDGSGYDLVVQFGEQDGEVWQHKVALLSVAAEDMCIALTQDKFEWAEWSTPGNEQIDLETIDYYGIFVEGQSQGPGEIIIDNLRVVNPGPLTLTLPPTPAPIPIITDDSLIVDNFESYAGNTHLNDSFSINDAWGANYGLLKLVGSPYAAEGTQAVAFEFDITKPAPNHYSGFERSFTPPQDWSDYSLLCFWIESDGSGYDLIIQFGESESEVWKHTVALSTLGSQEVCRTLSTANFEVVDDWPLPGNSQINLEAITYYGFFVQGPPQGPGLIYIDNLHLTNPTPTPTPPPTPTPIVACAAEPQGAFRAVWEQHKGRLGCPNLKQINPISGFFAEQPFENGHMYWSEIGDFYLVAIGNAEGNWRFFEGDESIWQEGMPPKSCDIPTPPGLIHPIRGFGGLWCQHEDIRSQIGWGSKKEEGFTDLIQTFDGGFIFQDSDGVTNSFVYLLFTDNGTFIRANY